LPAGGSAVHAGGYVNADLHREEEIANCLTHGFGLLLSIAGLVVLVTFAALRSDAWL